MNRFRTASNNELVTYGVACVAVLVLAGVVNSATRSTVAPPVDIQKVAEGNEKRHGMPDYQLHPELASKHVDALARQCRGDFFALPVADQNWLNAMTAGNGYRLIVARAKGLKIPLSKSIRPDPKPADAY